MSRLKCALLLGVLSAVLVNLGCAASPPCRKGPKDDVAMAARTAGAAVKTGVTTAGDGVVAVGRTAGGWVEGGESQAAEEWSEGKQETKATANEGASETDEEASLPLCE